jgi:cysteine desulfurase / selenocysteine lyase
MDLLKKQFPVFKKHPELVYLDSTATTQKPDCVINQMRDFIANDNATVHRGIYYLSQQATIMCEAVRTKIKSLINANSDNEIIFVKGTTEAINLVAQSYAKANLKDTDDVLITQMEHHANIVPWQQVCNSDQLKVANIKQNGELDLDDFKAKCTKNTKIVAITHISNVLGTVNPIKEIIQYVRKHTSAVVLVDGAQAVGHCKVDVQDLDCDFYCFSGHKIYGPTGIGILYGKYEILAQMGPYQTGGDMIETVSFEETTFAKPPARFEAGTPAIIEIIGLGAAIDFLLSLGFNNIAKHESLLFDKLMNDLNKIPAVTVIGTAKNKAPIVSFTLEGVHSHDVGTVMDQSNVAIRVGHHCAQPLMKLYNVPATARISIGCYNTEHDIDKCVSSLKKVVDYFK